MSSLNLPVVNPQLDLFFERIVDVPKQLVWNAWTKPDQIKKWFTPAPWTTIDCEIDLRPGGIFRTMMRAPEGHEFPNVGSYLEIVENEKLIWTTALAPGYRPVVHLSEEMFAVTAIILLEAHGEGTKYTAICLHKDEADRLKHEKMGFYAGWNKALDQLVAHVKTLSS